METKSLFATEVNEKVIDDAKKRAKSTGFKSVALSAAVTNQEFEDDFGKSESSFFDFGYKSYLNQNPVQIKEELAERANLFYNDSTTYFEEGNFEKTISLLNKAFTLNSFNIQFYLLKIESFIQLCDFSNYYCFFFYRILN